MKCPMAILPRSMKKKFPSMIYYAEVFLANLSASQEKEKVLMTLEEPFFDISRIVKFHKPKVLILENVKNILSIDKARH